VPENGGCLIIERSAAIFTMITLEDSIAAVANNGFGTAAWTIDAVTPANLSEQVCGSTLRDKRFDWERRLSGNTIVSPWSTVIFSDW